MDNNKWPQNAQEFRRQSQNQKDSWEVKKNAPQGKNNCHKIPNATLFNAFDRAKSTRIKRDILGFAHSTSNIFYSANNSQHTQHENNLKRSNFSAEALKSKGGSIENALKKMRKEQNGIATAQVMSQLRNEGEGTKTNVANLDKRTFNHPNEKQQIDAARKSLKRK